MSTKTATTIVLLGVMLLLAGALYAQDGEQMAKAALEQTDNLITYAGPLVHAANNPLAVSTFERAKEFQARAWEAYGRGDRAGYLLAYKFAVQARDLVQVALSNSRVNENQDGTVQRRLERAEERLDLAQQAMASDELPRLESLYQVARNNLDRAWEFFRAEHYRPALKLADQVEKAAKTILDAVTSTDRLKEQFDRRSSGVADLVAQANAKALECTSDDGRLGAEQATRTYELAQQLSSDGKAQQALKVLQEARNQAMKSIRTCSGTTVDESRLTMRYEALRLEMARLAEQISSMTGRPASQARILLDQAQELLARAKGEIVAEELRDAEVSLQAAHLAISKARDYIGTTR